MKKIIFLLNCIVIIVVFTYCSEESSDLFSVSAKKYVRLADYKSISIDEEKLKTDDSDIENIIGWDMISKDSYIEVTKRQNVQADDILLLSFIFNGEIVEMYYSEGDPFFENDDVFEGENVGDIVNTSVQIDEKKYYIEAKIVGLYRYPTINDTEHILNFYSCDNMDEVKNYITNRRRENIIFYHMWEEILTNSHIESFPDFVENKLLSEYAENCQLNNFYFEFFVGKAILETENIHITTEEVENRKAELSETYGISYSDICSYFSEEDIYFDLIQEKLKDVLIPLINIV